MNLPLRNFCLITSIVLCSFPAALPADNAGDAGKIISFTHNSPASDEHSLFRGAVVIKPWKGLAQEYRWGGSICPGKDLDIGEQTLLENALTAWRIQVQPYYKNGQGGYLCLVGFELSR